MDCRCVRSIRSRGLKKKVIFEFFLSGFAGRIVPIGYKKIGGGLPACPQYAAGDFSKKK
jgi:hypothetical protein